MHVAERTANNTFHFVVCNTGQGVNYHPAIGRDYPKEKRKVPIFELHFVLVSLELIGFG